MTTRSMTLTQTRIAQGVWEGELAGAGSQPPTLVARHQGGKLDGVTLTPAPGKDGTYAVTVQIPATILTEGVQTVLLQVGDQVLAHFTLITGVSLDDDLRAEIGLLRAELDLLKRAFRSQVARTKGQAQIS